MIDLSIAIMGIGLLLAILVLYTIASKKQKKKKETFNSYYQQLLEQHRLHIDEKESQRSFVLALDKSGKKLLYITSPNENPVYSLVDLKEVKGCKAAFTEQTFFLDDDKKRKETLTTQIALELTFWKSEAVLQVIFYDYIVNSVNQLPDIRSRVAFWEKQLKEICS